MTIITAESILTFWFKELDPKQWWTKDAQLDREIERRFADTLMAAAAGELWHWRTNQNGEVDASGRLAEIIVLDQFSRNIFRNTPQSFAQDAMALSLAQEAIQLGCLTKLSPNQQPFMAMPYMHSESAEIHKQAVKIFEQIGNESNLEFELKHKAIIDRFGRYPHRNEILGRQSTDEEAEFLKQPGNPPEK